MEYCIRNANISDAKVLGNIQGAVVGLMSAKGKEEFYERFGFWKRPNENFGAGMMKYWGNKD